MFTFLLANNFIEHKIQKRFTPHISGTLEHTAQMACVINQARSRQRSVVITLFDLQNGLGEVHHNLIKSVLGYHKIPDHIQNMINSFYILFNISLQLSYKYILYIKQPIVNYLSKSLLFILHAHFLVP